MAITYQITFDIHPDRKTDFLDLLTPVLDAMRQETSFLAAQLFQDPDQPNHVMLIETWTDHEDVMAVQIHRPYRAAYMAALPHLLRQPRQIQIWEPLRTDRAE
jgi:quinol monooxygenase YgiN